LPRGLGLAPALPPPRTRVELIEALDKPPYWDAAARELVRRDPVLARLIQACPDLHLTRRSDAFTALARAIVGQQISVRAADAVWRRFVGHVAPGQADASFPALDAAEVARSGLDQLRGCGLSERKAAYLRDLAEHFASRRLDPAAWSALDDESLIAALCDVKGIGRWTAEMFLIFHELRPDVFPVDDIGLQKAIALHYHRGRRVAVSTMRRRGESWRPWRSVATWYLWRSLDPVPVEY
jgi:DNA-3-methyladenine glycosylase II